MSLSTLLGLDQQPADLAGYGPITADTARDLASHTDATWRRLVTDPLTGALLDYGRTTYRPPADLRDFVLARDAICVYPHCNIPARLCQIDHIDPYHPETDDPHPAETGDKTGGDTSAANNAPLCVRNHQGKPEGSGNTTATTTAATNGKTPAPATPTEATYPNAGTTPPQSRRSNPTSRRSSQAVGTIGVNHRSGTTEL
ncbi:MAG: endonuclease [Pseudonocardiales bacterium]|nr:endonuclease [Pseudonocardiales bacterium]